MVKRKNNIQLVKNKNKWKKNILKKKKKKKKFNKVRL